MANSDPVEWILYSSDLTTEVGILPVIQGHLYLEFQEAGSGEVRIPLDSSIASSISNGQFVKCLYRGSARAGFFVDNIKKTEADQGEGAGRMLSISGRGPLSVLEDAIVWEDGSGASVRAFTGQTKAYIFTTLFSEAQTRGALSGVVCDFSSTGDSTGTAWTDSEDYDINVGQSMLDVMRMFAETGDMEFTVTLQSSTDPILLSAYKNGIGTDRSSTVFMRIGSNCEEVTTDERGDELKNVYLIKFKDGYAKVSDATSISTRRRREEFLSLEAAQSGSSATTYASAKLDGTKDPKQSISIRVYDGVSPYLFVNYIMGDTVTLDKFGTQVSKRILGIQADFDGDQFAHVVLELNVILYDNELRTRHQLDWLLNQWNTARDDNLTEVKQWLSIGSPNNIVRALHIYGDYLYVGGAFTAITGRLTASYIARYQLSTGLWSTMGTLSATVVSLIDVSGTIYAATAEKVYRWDDPSWTLIGSHSSPGGADIKCLATDGTDLYVGMFSNGTGWTGGVSIRDRVAKWNGAIWSSLDNGSGTNPNTPYGLAFFNNVLYAGRYGHTSPYLSSLQYWDGSDWQDKFVGFDHITGLTASDDALYWYEGNGGTFEVYRWDGVSGSEELIATVTDQVDDSAGAAAMAPYLSDMYLGDEFKVIDGATGFNNIAKFSGGSWSQVGGGFSVARPASAENDDVIRALAVASNGDVYAGGRFTTAGDKPMINLAVWVTTFESLVTHLSNSGSYDLGAGIHSATAITTPTANDEFPLWEDTTQDLRKVTFANLLSTLGSTFVKLDGSNNMTNQLNILAGGIFAKALGDDYVADFEQFASSSDVSSPTLYLYRETTDTGNITSPLLWGEQDQLGTGTISGELIKFNTISGTDLFSVLADGSIRLRQLADTDAVNDSLYYSTTGSKLAYKTSGGVVNYLW